MRSRPPLRKRRPVPADCQFCKTKTEPDYKDPGTLGKYTTERGKILARARTGVCSSHQRSLTQAIKRARHVALMPFVVRA